MIKKIIITLHITTLLLITIMACEKEITADVPPPPQSQSLSFTEEFDSVGNLSQKGWVIINNSIPAGPTGWRQGKYELGGKYGNTIVGFPAYSAVYNQNEFISADLNCGQGLATISCWLITREVTVKNGDSIAFYAKSHGDFPDRLQLRANFTDAGYEIGKGPEEVGQFTKLLLDINPNLLATGFPTKWTRYSVKLAGISGTLKARFAFRYYITNGGPNGTNSDMVGIDKLVFTSN